jgi:ABC-type transport system involved in multi-copper enzyme maturation permease subunit
MRAWLSDNPVMRRELLERWRGRRGFVILTAYLAAVTLLVMGMAWIISSWIHNQAEFSGDGFVAAAGPTMGRGIFENLLALVLFFVLFFTPAYAASQVSGERERRTLSLLQVTLVRPSQIVAGKLLASVAWLLVLIVAAAPIAATGFFMGGVNVSDFVTGLALIVIVAISVAAVALGLSSITRKTTTSIVLTYIFVLSLLIGPLFGALVEAAFRDFEFDNDQRPIALYAEPYYGLADAVGADRFDVFNGDFPSLMLPFAVLLPEPRVALFDEAPAVGREIVVDDFGGVAQDLPGFFPEAPEPEVSRPPVWEITAAIHLLLGALGFLLATRNIQPGRGPRWRMSRAERAELTAATAVTVGPPPLEVAQAALPPMDAGLVEPPPPPPPQQEAP